ncbi:MAG: hypothetical protein ACQUYJ_02780 [Ferruginibacter sp.]
MTQVNYNPEKSNYSHEFKGLGISLLIMIIIAAVNNYAPAIEQFLNSSDKWTIGGFIIAIVVVALVIRMYRLVTIFKKSGKSSKQS